MKYKSLFVLFFPLWSLAMPDINTCCPVDSTDPRPIYRSIAKDLCLCFESKSKGSIDEVGLDSCFFAAYRKRKPALDSAGLNIFDEAQLKVISSNVENITSATCLESIKASVAPRGSRKKTEYSVMKGAFVSQVLVRRGVWGISLQTLKGVTVVESTIKVDEVHLKSLPGSPQLSIDYETYIDPKSNKKIFRLPKDGEIRVIQN